MKNKKILILVIGIILLLGVTACGKKEEEFVGGFETIMEDNQSDISGDVLDSFESAKEEYKDSELDAIALLGSQVVAGTNYMFLAKSFLPGEETNAKYKIVIVYKDLENKSTITKVEDFMYEEYVNKNIKSDEENMVGAWNVDIPSTSISLRENIQKTLDEATNKDSQIVYTPIATLGEQIVSGTNYAVLCFGKTNKSTGVYVVTIYEDLNNNSKITSSAYVNLADFNK